MGTERTAGGIVYVYTPKKVKNLNLRVDREGCVKVSAPRRVPLAEVDRFVESRAEWIAAAKEKLARRPPVTGLTCAVDDGECLRAFEELLTETLPLADGLIQERPHLKVRLMKSRWGVCCPAKNAITLNKLLYERPHELQQYVMLHELVHFRWPDHQAGFHREMARRMPDYRERRKRLRG